jgi:nucleoside phosphorylase
VDGRYCTAQVAIITFLPQELDAVRLFMEFVEDAWGRGYLVDDANNVRVLLTQAERTQMGALRHVTEVLEDARPEVVIATGIAGGIPRREDVRPGDVVIPDYVHYFHYTKHGAEGIEKRFLPADQPSSQLRKRHARPVGWPENRSEWINRVAVQRPTFPEQEGREARTEPTVFEGSLVAADDLFGDPTDEDQKRLVRDYPDAVAVDMESMGVARALYDVRSDVRYNPQLVIIRAISDLVLSQEEHDPAWIAKVGDNNSQRKLWAEYAAQVAAGYTAEVIARISQQDDPRQLETGAA